MTQHIFQFESELQNSSQEAAPSSPSLSPTVSEKLERYGSSALSAFGAQAEAVANVSKLRAELLAAPKIMGVSNAPTPKFLSRQNNELSLLRCLKVK